MGSDKIAVIDLRSKDLTQAGTASWADTSRDVCNALADIGCFVALFDKVPPHVEKSMFGVADELFDLPAEVKIKNVNGKPYHGYVAEAPIIPLHQGLGIDYVTDMDEVHNFAKLMWPQGNETFCELAYSYSKSVEELNVIVMKMIFDHLGIEKRYETHMESTSYLLRFLKYRPAGENESHAAMPSHRDMTFLSILHQNQVNGLEVETNDGQWIGFEHQPNSFVVMLGDVGMGWSNDRIRSCNHRVTMDAKKTRYTLGLFTFANGTLEPPEELVDEEYPLKYKPFTGVGLLDYYATKEGRSKRPAVKFYCGI